MQCSVFCAVSLDGYIAREDGAIDWLDYADGVTPEGEDYGFGDLMASVDALVMGRGTFEKFAAFGVWPYGDTPLIVMSRRDVEVPEHLQGKVTASSESPHDLCRRLAAEGMGHLYVDGGKLIQSFLAAGLITDLTLNTFPVLLGSGIPLFGSLKDDVWLDLESCRTFDSGFVLSRYRVR